MLLSGTKVMKKRIMREEIRMKNIGIDPLAELK